MNGSNRFDRGFGLYALERLADAVFVHDAAYRLVWANRAYYALAGTSRAEALGKPYWMVFPKGEGPLHSCSTAQQNPDAHHGEERVSHEDGRLFTSFSYPVPGDGRQALGIHVLHPLDIDAGQAMPSAAFREAVDQARIPMLIVDGNRRIAYTNPAFQDLFGYPPQTLTGRPVRDLWPPGEEASGQAILETLAAGGFWSGETLRLAADGTAIPVHLTVGRIGAGPGTPTGYTAVMLDLRELKQKQDELGRQAYDLNERVKELRCLHTVAGLATREEMALPELLAQVVAALEPAFQYPSLTRVRIAVMESESASTGFVQSEWCLHTQISDETAHYGCIEVCYRESIPAVDEDAFLQEERALLEAVAALLAGILSSRHHRSELEMVAAIPEHNPNTLMRLDCGGRVIYANPPAREFLKAFNPDSPNRIPDCLQQEVDQLQVDLQPRQIECALGDKLYLVNIESLHQGQLAVYATDITQQHRAEQIVVAERDRAQMYLDVAGSAIIVLDREGNVTLINRKGRELLGLPDERIIGRNWVDQFIPESSRDRVRESLRRMMVGDKADSAQREGALCQADGSVRFMLWESRVLYDAEGRPNGILSAGHDITERKAAEAALAIKSRGQALLSACGTTIIQGLDEIGLYHAVCENLIRIGGYGWAWVALPVGPDATRYDAVASSAQTSGRWEQLDNETLMWAWREGPLQAARISGKSVFWGGLERPSFFSDSAVSPALVLPMVDGEQLMGLLTVGTVEGDFADDEYTSLIQLTDNLSQAVKGIRAAIDRDKAVQALTESETQLRALIEAGADAQLVVDEAGIIRFANPAARELLDQAGGKLVGTEFGHSLVDNNTEIEYLRHGEEPAVADMRVTRVKWRGEPCSLVSLHDLTERKQGEQLLLRLNRTLNVLSKCNQTLIRADDERQLLEAYCQNLVELGGYRFAWVGYVRDKPERVVKPIMSAGYEEGYLSQGRFSWCAERKEGQGPVGRSVREGRAVVFHDVEADAHFGPWLEAARARGYRSVAALPLFNGKRVFGTLAIYAAETDIFDDNELALLSELAEDLSYGILALRTRDARAEAEKLLRLHNQAVESTRNGVIITDALLPGMPIVYANPAFEKLTGYSSREILGSSPRLLGGDATGSRVVSQAVRDGQAAEVELHNRRKDGSYYWCELDVAPVRDNKGEVTHFVGIYNDITERKDYEAQLEHQANFDALTGLPNRNLLRDRLNQALLYAERHRQMAAVLFLDIDQFKLVNDSLGHGYGDQLLRSVAQRLMDAAREGDTTTRHGGDEFVIVLTDLVDENAVLPLVERLRQKVSQPVAIGDTEVVVTASIGAAIFPRDGEDGETLLKNADAAMYQAKAAGRDTFRFFTASMNEDLKHRLSLGVELRKAVSSEQIVLHYQPKVETLTGRVVGLEALARWQHPQRGQVSPAEFIPLAEELGLIVPLGEQLLRIACNQIRDWRADGLKTVPVAVNLSAKQFRSAHLVDDILAMIAATGLEPQDLEMEITESAIMRETDAVAKRLHALRKAGIKLAMDDFGTGYSSLSQLKGLPFSTLKIDRAFIKNITQNPHDAAIVKAVLAMGHSLGLSIVAEGVETQGQFNYLRQHHCDQIQGFLLARPMPASDIHNLLAGRQRLLPPAIDQSEAKPVLLLVDDEPNILHGLRRVLVGEPYQVVTTTRIEEAFEILGKMNVQVVVSDQRMPGMQGTEFLQKVREIHPRVVRVILSGFTDFKAVSDAINKGWVYKFLSKPCDSDELKSQLRDAFQQWSLQQDGETSENP